MRSRRPGPRIIAYRIAILIGTINETLVLPAVAPRVGNNPCSYLVFINLTYDTVSVKVELYAVVVSAYSKSMIESIAPCLDILHASHACCLVGWGRRDGGPSAISSHADTSHTTSVHSRIATIIIKPFLKFLPTFWGVGGSKTDIVGNLVPHGAIPLIITLHPPIIRIIVSLGAKESAIGASSIGGNVRNAYTTCYVYYVAGLIGKQPCEMGRILILRQGGIEVAIAVHLVSEHIANTLSRTARTAILIENGREILVLPVIDKWGQFYSPLLSASLTACHIISWLGLA